MPVEPSTAKTPAVSSPPRPQAAIGAAQPFYLAYQAQNDGAQQAVYGRSACRVLAVHQPEFAERPPMPPLFP